MLPRLEFSAVEAANVVLDALSRTHEPRANHGLQVAYYFCGDVDPFERSRFFGVSKDVFAVDHFMAAFAGLAKSLINLRSWDVLSVEPQPDGRERVRVSLQPRAETAAAEEWVLVMKRAPIGEYKDCWRVHRLLAAESRFLDLV